ncbi:MAG: hypothetical protein HYV75_10590, partial [Opitutae bacterium]|nr:hypothetical protein [Opitutae bacterium]
MTGALAYLYVTTVRNAVGQRLKRLRQPKYLFGAIVGVAYFYFFVFGRAFTPAPRGHGAMPLPAGAASATLAWIEPFAAPALAVVVLLAWLIGNSRAVLQFTEPETAFLFPAPVSRRTLINYKLLRSQLGIVVSVFFITLLFQPGNVSGRGLQHAAGWWVVFSTLNLHFIAASFARQQLLGLGLNPGRQRALLGGALLLLAAAFWRWLPAPADASSLPALVEYAREVVGQPPLAWLLLPFALVVRPYFAPDTGAFLLALGPALLLGLAHYYWVIRADVAFEEASLELAAKRAKIIADAREGRWNRGSAPTRPRSEPFRLAARGWAPVAFLWKNLIALGPFFRLRTWLIACAAMFALTGWLGADRGRSDYLALIAAFSGMFSLVLLVGGPMFMRREAQQTLTQLDITKAYPLAGWQIVLGQLLSPMLLLTFLEWFLLLSFVLAAAAARKKIAALILLGAGGMGGVTLVVPPLVGLLLCLPYAGVLYFPAWAAASSPPTGGGGGIELLGQRLIFMLGYLMVLVVALLPATVTGSLVFFIANALIGQITAFILTTLVVSVIL